MEKSSLLKTQSFNTSKPAAIPTGAFNNRGLKSSESSVLVDCNSAGIAGKPGVALVVDTRDNGTGGGGHPRCLATLPHNIEELIAQFKMQTERL